MKRKVSLFLFAVMVAVSLGATVVASIAMYRLVSENQDDEIHQLEASLSKRFAVFETMLRSQHERIVAHMDKVLPEIVAELEATGKQPQDLSVGETRSTRQEVRDPARLFHRSLAQGVPD